MNRENYESGFDNPEKYIAEIKKHIQEIDQAIEENQKYLLELVTQKAQSEEINKSIEESGLKKLDVETDESHIKEVEAYIKQLNDLKQTLSEMLLRTDILKEKWQEMQGTVRSLIFKGKDQNITLS
jgi:predicted RNase H-like nuclease (RuvC/YqgF family)